MDGGLEIIVGVSLELGGIALPLEYKYISFFVCLGGTLPLYKGVAKAKDYISNYLHRR